MGDMVDAGVLRHRLEEVENRRRALENVGLLRRDAEESFVDVARLEDASISPVIQVYAEDTLAKFRVLADLQRRVGVQNAVPL